MAKLADAADLKSAEVYPSWGFKSPSGHQAKIKTNEATKLKAAQVPNADALEPTERASPKFRAFSLCSH